LGRHHIHQIIPVYPEILKDVLKGSFFGEIECDIAVPDHLKEYFAIIQKYRDSIQRP
jgi:hypothetical protein